MDPLCEDYYSENPYGYCGNNPVNYVDPNGLMKVLYNPDGTYKETTHNNWFHNTFMGGRNILIMVIEKYIFPNLNFGNGRGVELMRM